MLPQTSESPSVPSCHLTSETFSYTRTNIPSLSVFQKSTYRVILSCNLLVSTQWNITNTFRFSVYRPNPCLVAGQLIPIQVLHIKCK